MSTINKKKIQKGWMMLIVCMLIQAVPFCIAQIIQPLFISSVIQEHGFSLTGFSLIFINRNDSFSNSRSVYRFIIWEKLI